jgi:hypothetical protein
MLGIVKLFGEGLCWGRMPDDNRLIHRKSIVLYGYSNTRIRLRVSVQTACCYDPATMPERGVLAYV